MEPENEFVFPEEEENTINEGSLQHEEKQEKEAEMMQPATYSGPKKTTNEDENFLESRRNWLYQQILQSPDGIPVSILQTDQTVEQSKLMKIPLNIIYVNANLKRLIFSIGGIPVTEKLFLACACEVNGIPKRNMNLWGKDFTAHVNATDVFDPKNQSKKKEWYFLYSIIPVYFRNNVRNKTKDNPKEMEEFVAKHGEPINKTKDFVDAFTKKFKNILSTEELKQIQTNLNKKRKADEADGETTAPAKKRKSTKTKESKDSQTINPSLHETLEKMCKEFTTKVIEQVTKHQRTESLS